MQGRQMRSHSRTSQSGFTLTETMIGMALLIGLGVVGLKLSQSMQKSSSGMRKMSAMSKVMIQMRTMVSNATVCTANFKDKGVGDVVPLITGKDGEVMLGSGTKMENDTIMVKEVRIENLMPERKRAQVSVLFERLTKDGRAAHSKKVLNIMASIQGGKIEKCLDFGGMLDDSLVQKLCWDADPENFIPGGPNDNFDCADNVAHLIAEVKSLYCKENGLVGDVATGTCHALDANVSCPVGTFLRGFSSDGAPDCYAPEPPDPVEPNPSPLCWEAPAAGANCTVAGPCGSAGGTQTGECQVSGSWASTTLTCKTSSANCAFFKEKPSAPLYCWMGASMLGGRCLKSGPCSRPGERATTKCQDEDGNFQAGHSVVCDEYTGSTCPKGGACDANVWDDNRTASEICSGQKVTQTNQCGDTREVDGRKTDGACAAPPSGGCRVGHPMAWSNTYATGTFQCAEYMSPPRPFTYEQVDNGARGTGNAGYCLSTLGGPCRGEITWECRNGSVVTISSRCEGGVEQ